MVIATSDLPDAGFDGSVYITLNGGEGASNEMKLANDAPSNFGVNSSSEFTIKVGRAAAAALASSPLHQALPCWLLVAMGRYTGVLPTRP